MVQVVAKTSKNSSAIFKFPKISGKIIGKLYFRKTYNNIFLTFTDAFNKVIDTMSGGQCSPTNNKRLKKAAHMIPNLIAKLRPSFQYYGINAMTLCLRSKGGFFATTIIEELKLNNIILFNILDKRRRTHNGVRPRKPRRV